MNSRTHGLSITPGRQRKKSSSAVILRSSSDEESRMALRTLRARSFAQFNLSEQSKILRVVYPERQCEILRCTQDDSERVQDDSLAAFFSSRPGRQRSVFIGLLPALPSVPPGLSGTLTKVRQGRLSPKDVKNEGRPGYVYENKGMIDKMSEKYSDISARLKCFLQNRAHILPMFAPRIGS
jgi:hypothetical protein